ncbi:hypothetical protein [Frankia sp. Cas3]|uniref:hypothetical protein n=1 Tax=Frankia sp. Cas3 TaxID=3073926 RepID=UPI002AD52DBA|nr:hypothetical protein [Frankia sp. Cas3]
MKSNLILAAAVVADVEQRITLPPSRTLVILGFVVALIALVGGRPLIAGGLVMATIIFAGLAAIAQGAPEMFNATQSPVPPDIAVTGLLFFRGGWGASSATRGNLRSGEGAGHRGPAETDQ